MQDLASRIKIQLFGQMKVRRGGTRIVNFPYDKVRALLAYLLLEPPTPHRRDRLAGILWPTQEEAAARHSLRQALSQLRKALAEDEVDDPLILAGRTTIQRNPDALLDMDVASFDRLLEQAMGGEEGGAPVQDPQALAEAIDLYRGELLPNLSLVDADSFRQWLQRRRQHYHERAIRALEQLVEQCEQRRDYQSASRHAQKLVELEPWREAAHRKLMLFLARRGRRAAALKQYELCRYYLDEMLDVAPEPETERLYRRIRQMASARFALPTPATPLISRQHELDLLLRHLREPDSRLVTLAGLGGIGKTRLAIEAGVLAAGERARLFLHGVVFVPLDAVGTTDHLVAMVAQALDLSLVGEEETAGQLLGFLQDKELLLILDQFEHLLDKDGLAFLRDLMKAAPDVTLLVTSRRRLGLQGEQLLPLGGLPVPQEEGGKDGGTDEGESAVDLFRAAMRRLQPDRELTVEDKVHVADICRLVAGMPLALELAASWTDTLSLQEIALTLQDNLDLLAMSASNMPPRHHSIRTMFAATWQRLEGAEQEVVMQIAVFRGGFTLAAAKTVTGVSPSSLSRLVRRSLVQYDAERDRYDLHPLVQQYCSEKLHEEGADLAALRDRYSAYYRHWLGQLGAELLGAGEEDALRLIDAEIGNVRQTWQWMMQQGDVERLAATAATLYHYYHHRGLYQEGAEAFASALQSVRKQATTGQKRIEAKLLAFQADMLRQQDDVNDARAHLEESVRLLRQASLQELDTRREEAFVRWRMALLTIDAAEARPLLEKSLFLYRDLDADGQVTALLADLGLLWKASGKLAKAEACFNESLTLRRRLAAPATTVKSSYYMAGLRMRQGRFAESEALLQEALAHVRQIDDQSAVALGLFQLAMYYYYVGRYEEAIASGRESVVVWEELGKDARVAQASSLPSIGLLHAGDYRGARRAGEWALSLVRSLETAPYAGSAFLAVGGTLLIAGRAGEAHKQFHQAATAYEHGWRNDWRARQAVGRAYAACALCHRGELDLAQATLGEVLHAMREVRSLIALMSTLPVVALWLAKEEQMERAIEVWTAACSQPHVANSRWFAEVVGRHVEEAASTLPGHVVAAAKERGGEWELWELGNDLLNSLFGHLK